MTHIACHINTLQLPFVACTVPLTFTLPAAGCTLIGRNGIGKSLLLELLAGQRRADSGKIEWLTPISWLSQFAPAQDHDCAASVADLIGVLGIFRPKTTKCSGGPAVCGLQRGITFFEIPIWALFE